MADEAVVRIVLERGGMGSEFAPSDPPPDPSPFPFDYEATAPPAPFQFDYAATPSITPNEQLQQSIIKQTRAKLDKLRESLALDELYAHELANAPDIEEIRLNQARKILRSREESAAIAAKIAEVDIPTLELTLTEQAKDVLKARQDRAALEAEVARLAPADVIPVFDPIEEARKKREKERQKAQIAAAYKDEFGDEDQKKGIDSVLGVARSLRGTIGGMFGPVIGSLLDVMSGMRRAEVEAQKQRKQKDLLFEATSNLPRADVLPVDETEPPDDLNVPADVIPADVPVSSDTPPDSNVPTNAPPSVPPNPPPDTSTPSVPPNGPDVPPDVPPGGDETGGQGGAGGLQGAVATAGMVGLIVAAAGEIDKAVRGAIKSTVGTAGSIGTTIASPSSNPAEPIAKLGEAASGAGEKLAGFGHGLTFVGENLKALSSIMNAVTMTAERYGEFSPEIAQAQAIAEIRQMTGDFRRSQEVSGEMAKFVMAQSDVQQRFEDIKVKLLTQMLPLISGTLRAVETIMAAGEGTAKAIEILVRPLNLIASGIGLIARTQEDLNTEAFKDPTEQILGGGLLDVRNNQNPNGTVPDL